jgi:hypothetical protein
MQSVLNGEPRLVRAEIMKDVQKITLTPDLLEKTYIASGNWDLLGSVALTIGWCRGPGSNVRAHNPIPY